MNESIVLSKEKYQELIDAQQFLNCLEVCGVDNWGGYDDACEMMQKEE